MLVDSRDVSSGAGKVHVALELAKSQQSVKTSFGKVVVS
jgi:hypothetical protein